MGLEVKIYDTPAGGIRASQGTFSSVTLNLCMLGNFACLFQVVCHLLNFFQNILFLKIHSGISSECQTVWIQIRPDDSSGLIRVQAVCIGYQQTTLVGKELMI